MEVCTAYSGVLFPTIPLFDHVFCAALFVYLVYQSPCVTEVTGRNEVPAWWMMVMPAIGAMEQGLVCIALDVKEEGVRTCISRTIDDDHPWRLLVSYVK